MFDKTKPGYLTSSEFGKLLRTLGVFKSYDDVKNLEIFLQVGGNEQDFVAFDDIFKFLSQKAGFVSLNKKEAEFRAVFNTFDESGDGFISEDELFEAMQKFGENITREELRDIMNEADSNNDGQIDYEEFVKMMSMGFGK